MLPLHKGRQDAWGRQVEDPQQRLLGPTYRHAV